MSTTDDRSSGLGHILKYTGVFGGVQGLAMLMSVVRNKLTSKLLGTVGQGLLMEYTSIIDGVHATTNCGVGFSSVRRASELFESGDECAIRSFVLTVRTWCLWIGLAGVVLCVAASPFLSHILFDGSSREALNIMYLSPMLLCLAITMGEVSVLKGLRRLKRVAAITALGAFATLLLTVPVYLVFGIRGIIIAMNISTAAVTAIHMAFTVPIYPWSVRLSSAEVFREGWSMIRIGVPYVLVAVAGSIMSIVVIAILKSGGGDEVVGLYRAGYVLMGSYAGLVFAAFDSDYFPRLSSVNADVAKRNELMNRQILVSVLLIAPLLIAMIVMMPVILQLLHTEAFLPATSMAVCAVFYPFFRAVSMPISYMALAHGDSHIYLGAEVIYDVASVLFIWLAFSRWGLTGAGIGLSISALFDVLLVGIAYTYIYKIHLSPQTLRLAATQTIVVGITLAVCLLAGTLTKYIAGAALLLFSAYLSLRALRQSPSNLKEPDAPANQPLS